MYCCTGEGFFNSDAVGGDGVFKSTDHGVTWAQLSATTGSSYDYCTKILCDASGYIYVSTRAGVFRSTNGGTSWTDITPSGLSSTRISDMELSSTGRLHVSSGIFTTCEYRYTGTPSTVTSGTWTSPTSGYPASGKRIELGCNGSTLYALPSDASYEVPTIYKSTDGGATWASTAGQPTSGWGNGQAWYDLAVDIDGSGNVIVGGLEPYISINGGSTWTKLANWVGTTGQYVHADIHAIKMYGSNRVLFGCDGGIHYSSDNGTTIRDRNSGLRIKQFYSCAIHPSTTNYFLAGAQDNGSHQFSTAGLASTVEVTGGDGAFVHIDQNESMYQFTSYVYNQYRRSTDGGSTWSSVTLSSSLGQFINPTDYDNTANIMYCGNSAGTYRRWTDPQTGSTSASVSITALNGNSVTAVTVSPYTSNRVYFGTKNDVGTTRVCYVDGANTIASGSAGTNISTGLETAATVSCIAVGSDDNHLIACFSNYGISNVWISSNGGTSWTAIDGNLPDMPVRWAVFYPGSDSKAYIATETGVWETTSISGGTTVWTANATFPTVRTDMLKYRSSDRTLAAATHGRGLWTAVIPSVSTADLQFQLSSDAHTETTVGSSGCRGYKDYSYNMIILNAPTGAATVTLSVAGGATATSGVDYVLTTNGNFSTPSTTLTFGTGVTTPQSFSIRVYDDAAVESSESFTLNYAISGSTDAQAGADNQSFVFTISDNDAAPAATSSLSGTIGVYSGTVLTQPFRGAFFDSRTQILYFASELTGLGFSAGNITSIGFTVTTKSSTQAYSGFTIKLKNTTTTGLTFGAFETGATTVYSASYSTVSGLNTFAITPFAWDGTSNLLVEVCWDNSTATANDLIQGAVSTENSYFDRVSTNTTPGCSISSNAFNFTTSARPVISFDISTAGTSISAALSSTKTAYLGPNDDVYFYDGSGNILARIKNLTSFDYGCTQVIVDRAGSSAAAFWNAVSSNYLTSKSFKVIPTNNTTSGSYQITLYYISAEVSGFNTAASPSTFASSQIVKVSNGTFIPDVTAGSPHFADAYVATGASASFGSTGSTITATFSNTGFSGFAVGIPGNSLTTADFRSKASGNYSDVTKWEYNIFGSNYIDANQAPTSGSNVTIQAAHSITLDANKTIGSGKMLTVNGSLDAGTNSVSGAGAFTLSAGGTLATAKTGSNGISQNITVSGTKTFTDGANYTFNGASTTPFGSLFTTVKPNNVTAGANITLDKPTSITGVLGFAGSSRTLTTGSNLTLVSTSAGTARIYDMTKDVVSGAVIGSNTISGTAIVERYIKLRTPGTGNGTGSYGRAYRLLAPTVNTSGSINANWQEGQMVPGIGATVNNVPGYGTHITGTGGNTNGFDKTQSNAPSLYVANNGSTLTYSAVASTGGTLNALTGYFLYVRGDRSMDLTIPLADNMPTSNTTLRSTGTLVTGTQTSFTNALSSVSGSMNLVTNPYASPIDWNAVFTDAGSTNLENYYTYWDPNVGTRGGFVTVTNGGTVTPTPSGGIPAGTTTIQAGQAFFVTSNGGGQPTISIKESHKTSGNNNGVFRPGVVTASFAATLFYTEASGYRRLADGVAAIYDNSFSTGRDDDDALEINNWDENIAINRNGQHLSIESRPVILTKDTLPLFMNNMKQRGYEFEFRPKSFSNTSLKAELIDNYLNTRTSWSVNDSIVVPFTVSSDPGSYASNRFMIVFGLPVQAGIVKDGIVIFPNPVKGNSFNLQLGNMDKGRYTINLFNNLGQKVFSMQLLHPGGTATKTIVLDKGIVNGTYQLQLSGENGVKLVSRIVKN